MLLDLLAPSRCLSCRGRSAPPWCRDCRARALPARPGCPRCADPWPGHACPAQGTPIVATVARWQWDGPVRDVIATAKSRGAWAGWERMADDLAPAVRPHLQSGCVLAAVPASPRVVRQRGIDHAGVLARRLGVLLDLPALDLLEVVGRQHDQGTAGGRAGRDGRRGAYRATGPVPAEVVLVDDVLTTGATVRAAAEGLGAAGAKRVVVAVIARAGEVSARPPGGSTGPSEP